MRVLIYWLRKCFSLSLPRGLVDIIGVSLMESGAETRPYRGIVLAPVRPYGLDSLAEVVDALELIRRTDPRRFARVERFIKRIVLANWRPLGLYNSVSGVCGLKKLAIPENSDSLAVYNYAATLVHEATHGMLDAKRFPGTRMNRDRIEKICINEEVRFLARFPGIERKLEILLGYIDGVPTWRSRQSKVNPQP